jgi:hypothetical protein
MPQSLKTKVVIQHPLPRNRNVSEMPPKSWLSRHFPLKGKIVPLLSVSVGSGVTGTGEREEICLVCWVIAPSRFALATRLCKLPLELATRAASHVQGPTEDQIVGEWHYESFREFTSQAQRIPCICRTCEQPIAHDDEAHNAFVGYKAPGGQFRPEQRASISIWSDMSDIDSSERES